MRVPFHRYSIALENGLQINNGDDYLPRLRDEQSFDRDDKAIPLDLFLKWLHSFHWMITVR
jgi:hypothetical protein